MLDRLQLFQGFGGAGHQGIARRGKRPTGHLAVDIFPHQHKAFGFKGLFEGGQRLAGLAPQRVVTLAHQRQSVVITA